MSQYAEHHAAALALLHRGRGLDAERALRELLQQIHVREDDYDEWVRSLVETYRSLGWQREAGAALAYLGRFSEAHAALRTASALGDAARVRELWARATPGIKAQPLFLQAAREFEELNLLAHAALAWAAGGSTGEALRTWERVGRDERLAAAPYEQALAVYNLGLAERRAGHTDSAHRQLARAQRLLEERADDFESRGESERAFDCYQVLLHLGRELGSFENLAEGYINCIRCIKNDNLKFFVLQFYEDFLRTAIERDELHAAATVCREAADYTRRLGLVYDRFYLKRSAELWWRSAEQNERDGGPLERSENAYLASIDAWAALGDFLRVRESYERLGRLALPEAKRARYRRVSENYAGVAEPRLRIEPVPEYLQEQHSYPPIWELDLVEWEVGGEVAAVALGMAGDRKQPAAIRRKALALLLLDLEGLRSADPRSPAHLTQIAHGLGELTSYAAERPLERLYEHPEAMVRRAVMSALRSLFFKRSLKLLARGLRDEDEGVREAALEALEGLNFPAAFDPLSRIFREFSDARIKSAALVSIGRIGTLDAGEFLIEVLRHEPRPLRDVAFKQLQGYGNPEILPILRRYYEVESGPARHELEQLISRTAD